MAVQIRLMGDPTEVAMVMAALVAGQPVTVMSDNTPAPNHRDTGTRMFGMAQLPGTPTPGPPTRQPARRARAERLDQHRRLGR